MLVDMVTFCKCKGIRVQSCQYLERQDKISHEKAHKAFLTLPHLTSHISHLLTPLRPHPYPFPAFHSCFQPPERTARPKSKTANCTGKLRFWLSVAKVCPWSFRVVMFRQLLLRGVLHYNLIVVWWMILNKQLKMNLLHS